MARILEEGAWTLSSWVAAAVGLAALLVYAAAAWRQRQRAAGERLLPWLRALALLTGLVGLWAATSGMLHALGRWSLAAHMGQHMLLFAYVPPLLAAARPLHALAPGLPDSTGSTRWPLAMRQARLGDSLVAATAVHSAVMWFWHHPAAITSTLFDDRLQLAMHASFVVSGLWFWSALMCRMREEVAVSATDVLALVAIMMQMGLLGALLTFSPRVLYPVCAERAPLLGLQPLADQQLAGLIMWVPACLPYLLGALWVTHGWFRNVRRQPQHRGAR